MGVWLDDEFPEHPKVEALNDDLARWLYVAGLCYANRNLTGGRIPKGAALRLTDKASKRLVDKLLATPLPGHGPLWEDHGDHYRIHNYQAKQQSAEKRRAEKEEAKARRSEHARKAALVRHGVTKEQELSSDRAGVEHDRGHPPEQNGSRPGAAIEQGSEQGDFLAHTRGRASAGGRATPASALVPSPKDLNPSLNHQVGEGHGGREKDQDQGQPHDGCGDPGCGHCSPRPPEDIGLEPGKPCEGCDECSPPDPLAERLATLWPGRPRMVAESKAVVATCRTVAADDVIDEAIGTMLALDSPPRTPRYLLSTVLNRLVAGGAYGEGDPRLDVLRTKSPAGRS